MGAEGKPSVYIAMPTAEGTVRAECMGSVSGTMADLTAKGIASRIQVLSGSDLVFARNALASYFLTETAYSHLLFVDRDMEFPPDLCRRMLSLGYPLLGSVYAKRALDLRRFHVKAREYDCFEDALAASHDFIVIPMDGQTPAEDGVVQVHAVGMGLTLISRDVLTAMAAKGVAQANRNPAPSFLPLSRPMLGFFDPVRMQAGVLLSEDYSFCAKWQACGGKTHAIVDADIGHIGDMRFGAPYITRLRLDRV